MIGVDYAGGEQEIGPSGYPEVPFKSYTLSKGNKEASFVSFQHGQTNLPYPKSRGDHRMNTRSGEGEQVSDPSRP